MVMVGKLLRFGRRQLHTIISRETIKPANLTPNSHPHTYNLSEIDLLANRAYIPLYLFYPNNDGCSLTANDKATLLKKSLSMSLTKYYHFAGRLPAQTTPYIECNDEGVVFVEARNDSELDRFRLVSAKDGDFDQLFPDEMVCYESRNNANLVGVQVNHFACGGVGLAVSMSHIVGDACTLGSFVNHWAYVALYGSTEHKEVLPLNPYFIQFPKTNSLLLEPHAANQKNNNHVMKKFMFPNSKLSDLKKIIVSTAAGSLNNPTRVESLTALLYKTAVAAAATNNSGHFNPSYLLIMADIRQKFVEKLPQTTVGNFVSMMMVPTRNKTEISLSMLVDEIKKQKVKLEGVENVQQAAEKLKLVQSKLGSEDFEHVVKGTYGGTSLCGFPFSKADFGWGKPMAAGVALRSAGANGFMLMDSPEGDGIEAHVTLEKKDMDVFQNDKELLSFCQINI
ncbi:hypothetical protein SSX86_012207 [Deinandra increscens subsp. villosa]|uniref:Transferase, Chloramphenicol acetyltransferase-like domain protein n=1 Tax=Deinandra increscens subsp. villosa TaxID=3103831 RepID=A0AAP0D3S6_9ASTR